MTLVLDAEGLEKTYGRRRVVDRVNLRVHANEIVGLLGPNGAGKSTSFRMICGLVEPDRGRVWLNGNDVTEWPMYRRARDGGMGYLPQESSVFRKLTVEQNVLAMLELLGVARKPRQARCDELLEQFKITHIRKSSAGKLSGGERRRLEIARCLVSNPKIVMLDEPFAGIDPVTVQSIQVIIEDLRRAGIAVLITDHAAREILQTVDRCYVISKGRVLIDGTPAEVKRHPDVQAEYLGDLDGEVVDERPAVKARPAAASPLPRQSVPPTASASANEGQGTDVVGRATVPRPHFLRPRSKPLPSSPDEG
jgi:lipopolysaccharide export system ATP-binding protein